MRYKTKFNREEAIKNIIRAIECFPDDKLSRIYSYIMRMLVKE